MNLKKIRFKLYKTEPVTLTFSAKGEGEIIAGDIKTTSDVEIINKDQHVVTVTDKKTAFEIELRIENGVGYVPVEQRQKEKLSIGEIAIDGIFTPIKNVNFTVENIRVGQRTDYNKVLMDIETDGSINPEEAIKRASQILIDHFTVVGSVTVPETSKLAEAKPKKASKKKEKEDGI